MKKSINSIEKYFLARNEIVNKMHFIRSNNDAIRLLEKIDNLNRKYEREFKEVVKLFGELGIK
jgi:hypothetical protein